MRATARRTTALVAVILLVAAGLRSYRLAELPPGVEHDEVAEWQIARGILSGHHALFFREAYGQEPLYLYLQAVSISFLGDRVFALRFTSFAVALLTMAACFRVMRRLFGPVAALVSLALMAVTFWPLFFARVAVRGMMLPLVLCLGADALLSNFKSQVNSANRQFAMAGVWFGSSAYTYLAVRALPILLLGFLVYLVLFAREQVRGMWRGLVLMLAIAAVIASPLAVYLWRNPDIQYRVSEVSGPLDRLQKGDPSEVLAGARDTALMFSVRGDQTVRDNWPYRPVFAEPASAALFYLGLAIALWRWRKPEYAFVVMWLVVLLAPTVVTAAPPNFVRALGALPPIFGLPGISAAELLSVLNRQAAAQRLGVLCVLAVVLVGLVLTVRDYFIRWPAHPETQFVWQTDLASVAHYLDEARDVPRDVSIAGLSNETMDDSSLQLLLKRRDLDVRWFDSRTTLVLPAGPGSLFIPGIVPVDPLLRARLLRWGALELADPSGRFAWFDLSTVHVTGLQTDAATTRKVPVALPALLDNGLSLLGYEALNRQVKPGEDATVLTYWQAGKLAQPPLKAFVHLETMEGKPITQSDGLDAPSQFWRSGDVIVQLHHFRIPPETVPGAYPLTVGLYNSQTGTRAHFSTADDHLRLPDVEVVR